MLAQHLASAEYFYFRWSGGQKNFITMQGYQANGRLVPLLTRKKYPKVKFNILIKYFQIDLFEHGLVAGHGGMTAIGQQQFIF